MTLFSLSWALGRAVMLEILRLLLQSFDGNSISNSTQRESQGCRPKDPLRIEDLGDSA